MLDEDQWLSFWVDARAMEGVARYNVDVAGEVFLKGGNLGGFTRRLAADNSTHLGRCSGAAHVRAGRNND